MLRNVKVKELAEANQTACDCELVRKESSRKKWEPPKLEDVSGKIMAQPYIRFT